MRPLLAAKADLSKIQYPVYASPKYDGIRALLYDGQLYTRKWKLVPNKYLQHWANLRYEDGDNYLDGEIIIGNPTDDDVFRNTMSIVMSKDKPLPLIDWGYYVFDSFRNESYPYKARLSSITCETSDIKRVHQHIHKDETSLLSYYEDCLSWGYEGIMIRSIDGFYKRGRSTVNQGILLKLKPESDDEAEIIGFEERMHNDNPARRDERGYTKRSSAKDGRIPTGTLGAFTVRNTKGQEFNIGTGFNEDQRHEYWAIRNKLLGSTIVYKYQEYGSHEAPRFPTFKGFRND